MTLTLHLSPEIEALLRQQPGDPAATVKEALVVDLYRRQQITHHQFAQSLNISRFAADELLKRHGVFLPMTLDQVKDDAAGVYGMKGE